MDEIVKNESVIETQTPIVPVEEVTETVQPGEKTDSALLLKSLQEERERRRIAEAERDAIKAQTTPDVFSDEGLALKKQIDSLASQIASRDEKEILSSLENKFAPLKDKRAEFEQYRLDNPGMRLETMAKAFLIDNDLLEVPHTRKGLETTTGGGRQPVSTDLSVEEIRKIRETNSRQYIKLVKEGKIKV